MTPDPRELSVDGPMARTVPDVALLWSAMSGAPRLAVEGDVAGVRVAWAPSCGGRFPVDPAVIAVVDAARPTFESLGCRIDRDVPGSRRHP